MEHHSARETNSQIYGEVPPARDGSEGFEPNTLIIENKSLRKGFTLTPNYILRDQSVSFGAKLTYTLLLSYAWQEGNCFPGQARLGHDLAVTRKAINKYLKELRDKGFVTWTRRGMGKTNVYYILDYKGKNEADVTAWLHQDVTTRSHQDVTGRLHKEYSGEQDPEEEYSDPSKFRKAMSLPENRKNQPKDGESLTRRIFLPEREKPLHNGHSSRKIAHVLDRFSKSDLHDPTHAASNITRALNLWRQSKLSEDEFLQLVGKSRQITFTRSGSIRKEAGYLGLKNLAPYFFQVLSDLVQRTTIERFRHGFVAAKA